MTVAKRTRNQSPALRARRIRLARELFPAGPDHPASRCDAPTRAKIVRMLVTGAPVKEVCRRFGCSRATVDRYRKAAGVPNRRRLKRHGALSEGWVIVNGEARREG